MIKAQCSECCGDKFYLDAYTDVAYCVECEKKFPPEKSIRQQVVDDLKKSREETDFKFLAHQGDF